MPNKVYLEITNVCNLNCSFCHKTKRAPHFMTREEFDTALRGVSGYVDYLYFHLMGEPLLHPELEYFLERAGQTSARVILTTNGTLLDERADLLCSAHALHKVSISLHSFEANVLPFSLDEYLLKCFDFASRASESGKICVLRLWNEGESGEKENNPYILKKIEEYFCRPGTTPEATRGGMKVKDRVYVEWGDHFEWPDISLTEISVKHSCRGLRDQIGILCDGTVVPCCLDAEGVISLGNVYTTPLSEILGSERAVAIRRGFESGRAIEPLCVRCGYASTRFYR